jgi:hypothetical protein
VNWRCRIWQSLGAILCFCPCFPIVHVGMDIVYP